MPFKGRGHFKRNAAAPRQDRREVLLVREYERFLAKQGLPRMSADELIHEQLTPTQRRWVSDFITRWESLMRATYRTNPAGVEREEAVHLGVTFSWVTLESAERGEAEEEGWHREKESMSFREAAYRIKQFMPYDAGQPEWDGRDRLWFKGVQEQTDFRDGSTMNFDVFVEGDPVTLGRLERWYHSFSKRRRG